MAALADTEPGEGELTPGRDRSAYRRRVAGIRTVRVSPAGHCGESVEGNRQEGSRCSAIARVADGAHEGTEFAFRLRLFCLSRLFDGQPERPITYATSA